MKFDQLAQTFVSQESDVNIDIDVNEGGVKTTPSPVLSDDPIEITPEPSEEVTTVTELVTSLESICESLSPLNLERLDSSHLALISQVVAKPLAKMGTNIYDLFPSLEADMSIDANSLLLEMDTIIKHSRSAISVDCQ